MCKDCKTEFIDVGFGHVSVDLSGWGTWNIGLDVVSDIEPTEEVPAAGPFLGVGDALRVARALAWAAVRLRWLEWRDERHWPKATQPPTPAVDGAR